MFADQDVKDVVSLFQARSDKTKFKSYVDEPGKDIYSESMEMVNTLIKSAELQNYMMDTKLIYLTSWLKYLHTSLNPSQ